MSEASWISPDEGLTATGLTRCLGDQDTGEPIFTQNHYSSTTSWSATKIFLGKDKIGKTVVELPALLLRWR